MASRKARIAIGIVLLLAIAGAVAFNVTRESRSRVAVQTEKVERRDLVSVVTASGEVRPQRYVNVSANVSGRITDLYVEEGAAVRRGQVLARIDSTRFEAATEQSQAALQASRAELERAEADVALAQLGFERQKQMYGDKLVSQQAYDQAEAELRMKEATVNAQRRRVTQQEAALASVRDDLVKTTVVAPMDGTVTSLQKEEGESVIGAQSFQPTVIMTIGDLSVMEAEILIDETDIRAVKLGQQAKVKVDALGEQEIEGKVTEIGSSAIPRGGSTSGLVSTGSTTTANQAKDFKVVVTLQDPPASLRPGLNATAEITTAEREKALAVPIQAVVVRTVDEKGKVVDPTVPGEGDNPGPSAPRVEGEEKDGVFVVEDGVARFRPVKTGIVGETEMEILDGVKQDETIVSGSYKTLRTLKNEAKVKLEDKEKK
jgi:HlyD family secretion protein